MSFIYIIARKYGVRVLKKKNSGHEAELASAGELQYNCYMPHMFVTVVYHQL